MKVVLAPTSGVVVQIEMQDGTKIEKKVKKISFTPFFTTAKGQTSFVRGQAVSDKQGVVDRFQLAAMGATGKITRKEDKPPQGVKPVIDSPPEKETEEETEDGVE